MTPEPDQPTWWTATCSAQSTAATKSWARCFLKGRVAMLQPYAAATDVAGLAPHDLRRTAAKLCRAAGGELELIQLLLGHASVQTTERYLGTRQDLVHAPNDGIKLRVAV